ncbi:MAG TPA: tetratricopeptide repeat protein [Myxococcota bacterium]|nr:tetratricopeptide repeat protein [Myxococcota bacterium]
MSLVNEMLRNLDRRAARPLAGRDELPLSADEPEGARPRALVAGIAAAVALAALVANAAPWLALTPTRVAPPPPPPLAALRSPALPDVALAPIAPEPPARVERLQLGEVGDGTRLALELSRPTPHRVERSADGRAVALSLEDAELGPDLPQLELRGTPVEAFEAERVDGELRIRLTTSRPVKARSVMRGDDSAPRLELDLLAEPAEPMPAPETAQRAFPTRPPQASGRALALWREALRRSERGDERGAESALREALGLAPGKLGVRTALVALLLRAGRLDEAEAQIAVGRTQIGDTSPYAALQARALLARGDSEGALGELEKSPPELARSPEHHALLAAVRERLGRHAAAAQTYSALLSLDAKRADWWLGLALAREGEGRSADALAAYRSASRLPGLGGDAARWVNERAAALSRGD